MTTIVTDRLVLTPIGPEHTADLVQLHADPNVAYWNAGPWSPADALRFATEMRDRWSHDHVGKWIAHRRSDGAPGLIEGVEGVHDDAPFALYRMSRPGSTTNDVGSVR